MVMQCDIQLHSKNQSLYIKGVVKYMQKHVQLQNRCKTYAQF